MAIPDGKPAVNQLVADTGRAAVLSGDGRYRYRLERALGKSERVACFVMLNPSTADAEKDDPTIRKCIGFARRWQCGRLVVVNLFAWRATDPAALKAVRDPVGAENDDHIIAAIEAAVLTGGRTVCAWGVHGTLHDRNWQVLVMLRHRFSPQIANLRCLRLTKDGHPEHPLLVPYSVEPRPFGGNVA